MLSLKSRVAIVMILVAGSSLACLYLFRVFSENQTLRSDNKQLSQNLRIQSDLQIRANAIDTHRTRELVNAKNKIDDLERAVANGGRRLQLNATCKSANPATTGSMVDGTSARLTDAAQRDYFTLRRGIETARSQIAGLQDYIRDVCLAR